MNVAMVMGTLGERGLEPRQTSGTTLVNFTLILKEKSAGSDGQLREFMTYLKIDCWGRMGDTVLALNMQPRTGRVAWFCRRNFARNSD